VTVQWSSTELAALYLAGLVSYVVLFVVMGRYLTRRQLVRVAVLDLSLFVVIVVLAVVLGD
jgi:surface polysaccharide O-acyltransferase-like enzyme